MGLQQGELGYCSSSCASRRLAVVWNDEHPKSAVKSPFTGLVKTLVAVIECQNHFKSEPSLYDNNISEQGCPLPRTRAARLLKGRCLRLLRKGCKMVCYPRKNLCLNCLSCYCLFLREPWITETVGRGCWRAFVQPPVQEGLMNIHLDLGGPKLSQAWQSRIVLLSIHCPRGATEYCKPISPQGTWCPSLASPTPCHPGSWYWFVRLSLAVEGCDT